MPWETFHPPARMNTRPMVTIAASGHSMTLNRAAFETLGRPPAVVLLWDAAGSQIGLRPAESDEADCYSVTQVGNGALLTVRAFLRYHGLGTGATRQLVAEMHDGILCARV